MKDKHLAVDSEIAGIRTGTDVNGLLTDVHKVLND